MARHAAPATLLFLFVSACDSDPLRVSADAAATDAAAGDVPPGDGPDPDTGRDDTASAEPDVAPPDAPPAPARCGAAPPARQPPFPVTFRLRNDGPTPVYLRQGCLLEHRISSAAAGHADQLANEVVCPLCPCAQPGCALPTCGGCAPDHGEPVAPGSTRELRWDGVHHAVMAWTAGGSCVDARVLPAGQYRLTVSLYANEMTAVVRQPLRVLAVDFQTPVMNDLLEVSLSGGGGGEPARPLPAVVLEPADRTTSLGPRPLKVRVRNFGDPVPAAAFDALAGAVSLSTWPERQPIAVDLLKRNDGLPAGAPARDGHFSEIEVKPRAPLTDRWYFLGLACVPPELSFVPQPGQTRGEPDGSFGVRFRPGSEPLVTGLQLCEKAAGVQKLVVQTSEPVRATRPLTEVVRVMQPVTSAAPACRSLEDPDGLGGVHVDLACEGIDLSRLLVVGVGAGLVALDGTTRLAPVELAFTPAALASASGCRYLAYPR